MKTMKLQEHANLAHSQVAKGAEEWLDGNILELQGLAEEMQRLRVNLDRALCSDVPSHKIYDNMLETAASLLRDAKVEKMLQELAKLQVESSAAKAQQEIINQINEQQ